MAVVLYLKLYILRTAAVSLYSATGHGLSACKLAHVFTSIKKAREEVREKSEYVGGMAYSAGYLTLLDVKCDSKQWCV